MEKKFKKTALRMDEGTDLALRKNDSLARGEETKVEHGNAYPKELMKSHPCVIVTFKEDYDPNGCNPTRYRRGEQLCLVWYQATPTTGWYAETEHGSFPIRARDFNRVCDYEIVKCAAMQAENSSCAKTPEEDWFGVVRWCDEDLEEALRKFGYEPTADAVALIRANCEHHAFKDRMIEAGWDMIDSYIMENESELAVRSKAASDELVFQEVLV